MITFKELLLISVVFIVVVVTSCMESPTGVNTKTQPDTVYIPVVFQNWVGWHYTFADSEPLNSHVTDKIRAGWDCTEVLEYSYWLRYRGEPTDTIINANDFGLVTLHAFVCVAPDPYTKAEPMEIIDVMELIYGY